MFGRRAGREDGVKKRNSPWKENWGIILDFFQTKEYNDIIKWGNFLCTLQKRTFFFLLEFDKILTNSCVSNYWEVNPPDQDIKISVSLSSVITVNIPSTGLFSSERAQSGTFIVPGQTSLLPSRCRKSCSQSSLLGRSNHAHC